ncbi:MAG: hypothetical protein ACTSRG_09435 [Candidatus Helarchaeota archaeon]
MKKKFKLSIILLIILCMFFIFFAHVPKSNAQIQVNSGTYNYTNVAGTDINATVRANVGILTDGGISLWGIEPTVTTNMTITTVIVRGTTNGSSFNRGLAFPSTAELKADTKLTGFPNPPYNTSFGELFSSMKENLLLIPELYGIPNYFSFNLSIYIAVNATKNQTISLTSNDSPLVTIIFRNPDAVSDVGNLFVALMYTLPFVLPITVITIYLVSNKMKKKKKNSKGGQKAES